MADEIIYDREYQGKPAPDATNMSTELPATPKRAELVHVVPVAMRRILVLGIAVRLFIDTGVQIFGPFLSIIATGLGTSIVVLGALNSLRALMGLASPAFGVLADRTSYRRTMRIILLLGAAGMFLFGGSWNLWVAAAGISLMGLSVFCFAPILQAYMSAQIPYEHRARGLGTVEYAWALAGIIGLSISGLLMSRYGWRAPFYFLGFGMLGAFFLFAFFPAAPHRAHEHSTTAAPRNWRTIGSSLPAFFHLESNSRSAWSAIIAGMLGVFATANITIVYGSWLTDSYGLNPSQLGIVALILGFADLVAIVLVTYRGDHFGKYRSLLVSTTGAALTYMLLPVLNVALWTTMLGLLAIRITFESGMVSNISLLSEQSPTQRGRVLTLFSAAVTVGAAGASFTGPFLYSHWGILGLAASSAGMAALAALLILARVRESESDGPETEMPLE